MSQGTTLGLKRLFVD